MVIGEKIKRLRILNNLTQEELALRCDLTKGFISKLERDLTSPSIATLVDILEALGTDLKDFFNESSNNKIVFGKEDIYEETYSTDTITADSTVVEENMLYNQTININDNFELRTNKSFKIKKKKHQH